MRGAKAQLNAGRLAPFHGRAAACLVLLIAALGLVTVETGIARGDGPSGGVGAQTSGNVPRQHRTPPPRALRRTGMWIWYVSKSNGGNASSIIAMAHRHAVSTVIVKSGDGPGYWSQFSSRLVTALHEGGLDVCAWQFVYGSHPLQEANAAIRAIQAGADCLLIDAEGEYQGRYAAAQTYLRHIRSVAGASFPLGLASFPYVDYHPGLPYSVFLGPGGAQFDVPQMYWRDIGVTTDAVYAHTYVYNRPYLRTILPLGEVTGNPPAAQIERFRQLRRAYRAPAISWWDWQGASAQSWNAISATIPNLKVVTVQSGMPFLSYRGNNAVHGGDLVVWAQEHLYSAGYRVTIDGMFGPGTRTAVLKFQTAHGLPATGQINTTTWTALLRYPAVNVTWSKQGATPSPAVGTARAGVTRAGAVRAGAGAGGGLRLSAPLSARLPARAYEIPAHLGQG